MMKSKKYLWALLPIVTLLWTSCSSNDAVEPANEELGELKLMTIEIPVSATADIGEGTRATVLADNKTLNFAYGDSLWVTGKISAETANAGDGDYPYTLNGWLSLMASGDAYVNPHFDGVLYYKYYDYSNGEHPGYTHTDGTPTGNWWPGPGSKNPVYIYNTDFTLYAILKGLYQDKASWPGEVSDVSQVTSLNFSGHPLCVANGESSALNEAVKKYSLLIGSTGDTGLRATPEDFHSLPVYFQLYQKTVFLNFTVTFYDGTTAGTNLGTVTVNNNGSVIGSGAVTTTSSGGAVIANFVVPVAGGTVLNEATLNIPGYYPMNVGTNETLVAGTVYSINKTMDDAVQLWEGGPYFATKNIGASSVTDYGKYFAWGETEGFTDSQSHIFSWANYEWATLTNDPDLDPSCDGYSMKKYYSSPEEEGDWKYGDYPDGKRKLEAADDAATANWGSPWRMPDPGELGTLTDYTGEDKVRSVWYDNYNNSGVSGYLFIGKEAGYTDHAIFLPAAGCRRNDIDRPGWLGQYWSSYVYRSQYCGAWSLYFQHSYGAYSCETMTDVSVQPRYEGYPVRAVRDTPSHQP